MTDARSKRTSRPAAAPSHATPPGALETRVAEARTAREDHREEGWSEDDAAPFGGIDLGGTKIEARLFAGADAATLDTRRVPTPRDVPALIEALADLTAWLNERAEATPALSGQATRSSGQATRSLPIGLAVPGVVAADGGVDAANLPRLAGKSGAAALPLAALMAASGSAPGRIVNDCLAFVRSEATGGAAEGAGRAVGIIVGTGMSAALWRRSPGEPGDGRTVEIGHCGIAHRALARHDLHASAIGDARCGCGLALCHESLLAGPGLARLAAHLTSEAIAPEALAAHRDGERVLDVWADIMGEALRLVQVMLEPEVVVLGGGLSRLPGVIERLEPALSRRAMPGLPLPALRLARHGDSSGARGAALIARDAARAGGDAARAGSDAARAGDGAPC